MLKKTTKKNKDKTVNMMTHDVRWAEVWPSFEDCSSCVTDNQITRNLSFEPLQRGQCSYAVDAVSSSSFFYIKLEDLQH